MHQEEERQQSDTLPGIRYPLLRHLECCCKEEPKFRPLINTYELAKKNFEDMLATLPIYFGAYSRHDISHSETIIANIEQLLGRDRIPLLSPTDTWLILMAAYAHDIGMMLTKETVDKLIKSPAFLNHVIGLKSSAKKDLSRAAEMYLGETEDMKTAAEIDFMNEDSANSGLKIIMRSSWYAHILIADYCRKQHAQEARHVLRDEAGDLTYSGIIPERLNSLMASCAAAHGDPDQNIIDNFHFQANGFLNDTVHPRFVAMLLKLGDSMDIENNRFNPYMADVFGGMPDDSHAHKTKHLSITHFYISPKRFEVTANIDTSQFRASGHNSAGFCHDDVIDAYKVVNDCFDTIKCEISFFSENWFQIVPTNFPGRVPEFTMREINIDGKQYHIEAILREFEISYNRAFSFLKNFFSQQLAFCRELVQNAFDATKIQLFRTASNGLPDTYMEEEIGSGQEEISSLTQLQCVLNEINRLGYRVHLFVREFTRTVGEKTLSFIKFTFVDNGIGIDQVAIKRMKSVGEEVVDEIVNEVKLMPGWLKPTGDFGVGIHSAFIYTDEIRISTLVQRIGYEAELWLRSKNRGEIIVIPEPLRNESLRRKHPGSTVVVEVRARKLWEKLSTYPQVIYDAPDIPDFYSLEESILDILINRTFTPNITPLVIKTYSQGGKHRKEKIVPSIFEGLNETLKSLDTFDDNISDNKKLLSLKVGDCIVWREKQDNTKEPPHFFALYGCFDNEKKNRDLILEASFRSMRGCNTRVAYKGSYLQGETQIVFPYADTTIHILGRKAKTTVTTQRDYLKPGVVAKIRDDAWRAMDAIIMNILKKKDDLSIDLSGKSSAAIAIYLKRWQWSQKQPADRDLMNRCEQLLRAIMEKSEEKAPCYMLQGQYFCLIDSSVGDFLSDPLSWYYFRKDERQYSIETRLRPLPDTFPGDIRITGDIWGDMNANISLERICVLEDVGINNNSYVCKYAHGKLSCAEISDKGLEYLLRDCLRKKRAFIPGVKQFESLIVSMCDEHTARDWKYANGYIKLPDYLLDEGTASQEIQPDFIESVYERQVTENKFSRKEIKDEYDRLIALIFQ